MRTKYFHLFVSAIVALFLGAPAITYAESNDSHPVAAHVVQPSPAATARKNMRVANRKLAKNVRTALTKRGDVEMSRVMILAKGGSVALTGSVPEQQQIQLAEEHASGVDGVTKVENRLIVSTSGH